MVICAELSTVNSENPPIANKEYFRSLHYHRDACVPDSNNNNGLYANNNNSNSSIASKTVPFDANRYVIKSFYRNACVLVTGGTGFLGKVLLEKLLRSCETVQCIYVLLRSKRGLSSEQRYRELIQNPVKK